MYFKYSQNDIDGLIKIAPFMKDLINHYGKIKFKVHNDLFEALIFSVIFPQTNADLTLDIQKRLQTLSPVTPKAVLRLTTAQWQASGLSQITVNKIKEIALSVKNTSLNLERFQSLDDQKIIAELMKIKGIHLLNAQIFLIFGLQRTDVFMPEDLILNQILSLLNINDFDLELFSPYNSLAAMYLWTFSNNRRFGISFNSPIGKLTLIQEGNYLVNCFALNKSIFYITNETALLIEAKKQLLEYFDKKRTKFCVPLRIGGSDFKQAILTEMQNIPYGTTIAYKDLATHANYPLASRACGQVCNKNPLLIFIPCHRILSSSKKLHGFAYGLAMKQQLLDLEN